MDVGNKHCTIFCDKVDDVDMEGLGQAVISSGQFPGITYIECVRVVNDLTLKLRVWDRVNGEMMACGTAAAAVTAVAVELGMCQNCNVITVKLRGGDLFVRHLEDGSLVLDGSVKQSFEGVIEI